MSEAQAEALKVILGDAGLDLEQAGAVTETVVSMPWAEKDRAMLLRAVASLTSAPQSSPGLSPVASGRHKLQNYEALHHYLPKSVWASMASETSLAIDKLASLAGALG